MGVPSLNDLAVDGTLNTTNQPVVNNLFESERRQREAKTSRIGHGNHAFAPFITFLFLSILARMRGSRDLCVTSLLLAEVFLTRTDYIPSHWLRGQGYKTTTKNQKARGYVKKRPYASTHHQSRMSPFSKNRRQ